jgi:peroxiredoxin Q/BCP
VPGSTAAAVGLIDQQSVGSAQALPTIVLWVTPTTARCGGSLPDMSAPIQLTPGDKAPAISLPDQDGTVTKLSAFKGRKVLVYFYPKADTPGCTTQSCALRDIRGDVGDTAIVGISPDAPAKQKKFDDKYSLGFPLLADVDHAVAEAYGVWAEKSMYGRKYFGIVRSAFLIDEKGKIAEAWYKISPKDTPVKLQQALAAS